MPEPLKIGYYNTYELKKIGLKKIGKNVLISKNINIVGVSNISIGDNVRIDSYTNIIAYSGYLRLGNFIHISSGTFLACAGGIEINDFSTISPNSNLLSVSSDYTGKYISNPMVPKKYCKAIKGKIILKKHTIIGAGSVIMNSVIIGEGTSVGALSFVNKNLDTWSVYAGIPVKKIKNRLKRVLELEKKIKSIF